MIIIASLFCNQNCKYCHFYKNNLAYFNIYKKNENEIIKKIINFLKIMYKRQNYYLLRLFGAEPLLFNELDSFLFKIVSNLDKKKKKIIFINTNLNVKKDRIKKNLKKILILKKEYNSEIYFITTFSLIQNYFIKLRNINYKNYNKIHENLKIIYLNGIKIIVNYVIDLNNLDIININQIIKDILQLKNKYNIHYFNILPIAYNYIYQNKQIDLYIQLLQKIKEQDMKNKILPTKENYFENYFYLNKQYYIPLYPRNLVVDFYGNITYNLVNYENFYLLQGIITNFLNKKNINEKLLFIEKNKDLVEKEYLSIKNKLYNFFGKNIIDNTYYIYNLTNKILYN